MSPEERSPAVELQRITKRYGGLLALDGVSFTVAPGEVFGFLGPNGAGKTTAIRILLDLLRPDGGSARIHGLDCQRQGLRARAGVGYLPGEPCMPEEMTGREILDLLARLEARGVNTAYRDELIERLALRPADLDRRLREYSAGMKRKLGIVQAFQTAPSLLVLDEPTEGLDPLMQDAFFTLLREVRERGRTVFLSSHVLSEVERVCDRVALLRQGALVLVSTVDDLRALAARTVRVVFGRAVERPEGPWPDGCEPVALGPSEWKLTVSGALGPLLGRLSGLPVADLEVQEPHLEDVLLRFFREGA